MSITVILRPAVGGKKALTPPKEEAHPDSRVGGPRPYTKK